MEFRGFKDWILLGLLSVGIYILGQMKSSVEELNVKVAVMIEKSSNLEKRVERLEVLTK